MIAQFFTIGLLILIAVMLPGPDFALVTTNTVLHSRRAGLFTSLGISSAALVHMSYCIFGLAIIISESIILFNIIKYVGAIYLIYLGIVSLLSKPKDVATDSTSSISKKSTLSDIVAFQQGFLCNLLNPKATLFFLALFTVIIKPTTPTLWNLIYAVEMYLIITIWFFSLTIILSQPRFLKTLNKIEIFIPKILGIFLIGFGLVLAFLKK